MSFDYDHTIQELKDNLHSGEKWDTTMAKGGLTITQISPAGYSG